MSKKGTSDKFPDRHKVVDAICERLAQGEGLTVICRDDDMPNFSQVYKWRKADPALGVKLDEARAVGFDILAEGCIDIADDKLDDPASRKVRVWTRLQLLAKWDPRRYGERMQHANDPNNPMPAPQFIIQPVQAKE